MKQKLITEIIQGMLGTLNNAQLKKLQKVLEHTLFSKEITDTVSEDTITPNA